jgi:hypothetical protein
MPLSLHALICDMTRQGLIGSGGDKTYEREREGSARERQGREGIGGYMRERERERKRERE